MKKFAAAFALALSAFTVPAFASPAMIDIVNESSSEISAIHMTDIDEPTTGRDLLGQYTLPAGYKVAGLQPDLDEGYCRYDLIVTFEDGSSSMLNDFNACEALQVTIYDRSFGVMDLTSKETNRRGIVH